MVERSVNYKEMNWEEAVGYPDGTRIKLLRKENGPNTVLLQLPQGFQMDAHCHTTTEQHFVLEGEYRSGEKTYRTGSYRIIPAGANHGPFQSEKGAVVLVIWDPE
jgi:quercetin dioxygenase-like cupin family protein